MPPPEFDLQPAGPRDIPVLVNHHRRMFEEILVSEHQEAEGHDFTELDRAYTKKLTETLGGSCLAWIVRAGDRVAASCALSVVSLVPVPHDPSCTVGCLHSLYTEKTFRRRGCAGLLIEHILPHCRRMGIKRVLLNASRAGWPLYAQMGFEPVENAMRRWVG